jgi:peptide/nickel transport system ATP-binding protein
MTARPLISIRSLDVEFHTEAGVAHVLRGIDLDIPRGQIVGVVGESGSGKSTLASAVLGLLPPNVVAIRGEINLDGTNLLTVPPGAMRKVRGRRIAMIFQDPMTSLNPVFTVGTQLVDAQRNRFPKRRSTELRQRAIDMMHRVGIPDPVRRIRQYPHEFSGGMRQRIMIAMALLTEPDLLIADEPTTALDVTIEAQIIRLFETLRENFSGSMMFISHSLAVVSSLCDSVAVMYAGRIAEVAPSTSLFSRPRHPYTQALLACEVGKGTERQASLRSIPGRVPDLVEVPEACIFADRCDQVIAGCRSGIPPLRPITPHHSAACIVA